MCFSCTTESSENPDLEGLPLEKTQELNVAYGDEPEQVYDIYLPANRNSDTKTLVLLHGGGWTSGDKSDMDYVKDLIQESLIDVAIVNMNYRLADEDNSPFPMQIDDISLAIQHLKDLNEDYVISDQIGFVGVSAGAHLALLYSYAFDNEKNVNMVCSIVGPTNFTDPSYFESDYSQFDEVLNLYGIEPDDTSYLKDVSPYHNLTTDSPPTILFYGAKDPLVPSTQGTDLRDRLNEYDIENELTLYENQGHGWAGIELLDTWTKLRIFIGKHL